MNRPKKSRFNYGYYFVAPFVVGFLLFGLYPVYNTIALSFTDTTLMSAKSNFVGLANFKRLFADSVFMTAVKNTWLLWVLNFIPQLGIAMLLSVWFTSTRLKLKAVGVWRMLFYLPNLLMPAAIAALFFSLFSFYGPVNQFMVRAGFIPEAIDYLRNPTVARALVVFIQWWMWFGQTTIILMAGMTSISVQVYEAALVDGATSFQMFRYITLPLIKPVTIYILVTSLVGGMQMFDIPMLLTDGRGSPANSILTNNILMYMKFRSSKGHIGAAASVGVLVFIMTTICSLLIFYLLRDKDANLEEAED
ncbi:carbohydrate ABC transporter permease [Levilinea saccharolytica]|uniref:Sugar ABC transporter permease n=1 Tax=Levilinea saccharolytica TaxID=229921 RepID=A0A0P6XXN5_9CHLR|nr:sugar ABC transporter permease [Levilinea saccharolytica]KPL80723.1 sugar ABC transporter permease [Levilinea saccharolytica]GAP17204.1 carbohydrate ABC transporter membrane protein 1, CUT1 family [Levilinea saccharolytica]